ncbi:hypothetical protein [Actinoplanes sp. DH11]|uniref:hypothetical protein n=1 Tax=Actinoplanes sp. DH11 TaxID=2857011 RepID=UPI001E4ABE6A|nr:hypothetical protein [Actinoplanes sp. DH11]
MNRRWSRLLVLGACASFAGPLLIAPAQAAPVATSAVTIQNVPVTPRQPADQAQGSAYEGTLGRVYHHDEYKWCGMTCGWKLHRYYTYVKLTLPDSADIEQMIWDQVYKYMRCVVQRAGVAIVITSISTGGVSLPIILAAFEEAGSYCGDAALDDIWDVAANAILTTYVDR